MTWCLACFSSFSKCCDLKDNLCHCGFSWYFYCLRSELHNGRFLKWCVMYGLCDCHQQYVPIIRGGKGKCKWNVCLRGKGSELPESEGTGCSCLLESIQVKCRALLYPCSGEHNLPFNFLTVGTNSQSLLTSWRHKGMEPALPGRENLHKIN